MSNFEIISLIISGVNAISIFILLFQLHYTKAQLESNNKLAKEHYEEQRRIKTVDVLHMWNSGLKKETRLAEKIVETLDEHQCTKLYDYSPFEVSESTQKMICQMCSKGEKGCQDCQPLKNGNYLVDGYQLVELRGNVTNYLNNLEIVAVAWQQAIVDREAVELQFSYLYNPGKKSALNNYRKIAGGGNSFPELNEFYNKIKSNNKKGTGPKPQQ